jgi:hypothetical protein
MLSGCVNRGVTGGSAGRCVVSKRSGGDDVQLA